MIRCVFLLPFFNLIIDNIYEICYILSVRGEITMYVGLGMNIFIILCDIILLSLTFITCFLGIWHHFDKSIGADEDIYIFWAVGIVYLIYNFFVGNFIPISFNREKLVFGIVIFNIFLLLFFVLMFSDKNKINTMEGGEDE